MFSESTVQNSSHSRKKTGSRSMANTIVTARRQRKAKTAILGHHCGLRTFEFWMNQSYSHCLSEVCMRRVSLYISLPPWNKWQCLKACPSCFRCSITYWPVWLINKPALKLYCNRAQSHNFWFIYFLIFPVQTWRQRGFSETDSAPPSVSKIRQHPKPLAQVIKKIMQLPKILRHWLNNII